MSQRNKNDHNLKIALEPETFEDVQANEQERSADLMKSFATIKIQNKPDSQRQKQTRPVAGNMKLK